MRSLLAPPPRAAVRPGRVPTFSVLVAAYQVSDVIGEALDSAFEQTLAPHEVVVCDDGSTDALEEALEPYRDRIVFVRKENGGEASAKNAAARAASGEFVTILDADDLYFPERLEALGELAAARPDLDILTSDALLEVNGEVARRCYTEGWTFEVEDQRAAILERNFVFGLAAVRRERLLAVGGFDESIRWTTDWDLWARLILDGALAGAVDEPLALYRLRESSLSSDRARLIRGRVTTLGKAARHPSLDARERAIVTRSLAAQRCELALVEARSALLEEDRSARRRSLAIVVGKGFSTTTRLKAAAAFLAPGRVGRRLRRRYGDSWVGAGGIRVARDAAEPAPSDAAQAPR